MKMKRIAAGLLSFILLMGNSLTVFATQPDTVIETVSGNEVLSENDEEISEQTVSGNDAETLGQTVSANNASASMQSVTDIPEEYIEIAQEAKADLQSCLEEKDIFAIVYLTDSYAVKEQPEEDAKTVVSIPMARTVQILDMDVEWKYQEKWEEYIPTVWYETQFYVGETLYSGYIEENYLAYSDEVLLQWKDAWYMLFPISQSLYSEINKSVQGTANASYADVSQFPVSYQSALNKLKAAHPNWIFVPMKVNRNWDDCVAEQKGNYSWIYYNQPAEYRGAQINSQWYYASEEGIAYYMDPRNFLTEANIFQFEQNTYNASYHTQDALQAFLNNTFMKGVVPDDSQKRTYAKVIFDSGKSRGLSPFNLAARVIQEQGVNGTSAMISGTYPGYEGYYNHYNISASGTTNAAVFKSGLTYAKNKGWNTRVKSLEGGAAFIGNGYILQGQDTLYLQKFDIEHGSSSLHQYMQNIMAPYTEGRSMKTMYTNAGSLNSAFVFKIPVFNNMPNEYNFTINTKSVTLQRGVKGKETYTLIVKCNGDIDKTATFKSANEKVATVSDDGVITAVGSGETTITITVKKSDMEEAQTFTCTVKVLSPLQGISLNVEEQELFLAENLPEKVAYLDENGVTKYKYASKGELPSQVTLEVSYDPSDTTDNRTVTWTVADENIVSIEIPEGQTQEAVITAKSSGTTTVTAKVGKFTQTATVTVRVPMTEAKLNLEQNEISLYKGETTQVKVSYSPKDTTDRIEPVWTSEDESVAVIENGMIIAKGKGSTKLHAAIGPFDGSQNELTVKVTVKEYTVTFMGSDGTTELMTVPGEYGKSLASLTVPEDTELPWILEGDEDSYFVGWYTEKDGTGNAVSKNTILYGDMTLYPYFKEASEADFYIKPIGSVTYTGAYIKPDVQVYSGSTLLKKDADYTLSYKNNKAVNDGTDPAKLDKLPTVIITGKGKYAQWQAEEYFYITAKNISQVDITAKNLSVDYTGNVQKLRPTISDGGRTLVNNVDYTLEYPDTEEGAYKEAGTYPVKVTGKGNYEGTRYLYITITKRVMMEDVSVSVPASVKYNNGKTYSSVDEIGACEPEVTVKYNGNILIKDTDYTLSYSNHTEIGTASVTVTGLGAYIGSKTVSFKIVGTDISTATVTGISNKGYTGEALTQSNLVLKDKNKTPLRENLDYTVTYKNNTKTGKASVVFTGIHGYTGSLTKTFTIEPYDISKNELTYEAEAEGNTTPETRKAFEVSLISDSVEYDKAGAQTDVTVTFKGEVLTKGTDYKVSYRNNNKVTNDQTTEMPMVVITGKGSFEGELTKTFAITTKNINKVTMSANNVTFRNKKGFCFVEPVLKDESGRRLEAGTDYTDLKYTYVAETLLYDGSYKLAGSEVGENDIPVAKAGVEPYIKVTAKGTGNYTGEISCTYQILEDKTIFEQIFPDEPENNNVSAGTNQNVIQDAPVESTTIPEEESKGQTEAVDDTTQSGVEGTTQNVTRLPETDSTADQTSVLAQIQQDKQELLQDTVGAMSESVKESDADTIDSDSVEEMQQITEGAADELQVESVSKKSHGAIVMVVIATVCLAFAGGAAGIKLYRKKKTDNFFFDEEDDFLD